MGVPTTAEIKKIKTHMIFPSQSGGDAGDPDGGQNTISNTVMKIDSATALIDQVFIGKTDLSVPNDTKYPNSRIGDTVKEYSVDTDQSETAAYEVDEWIKGANGWINLNYARKIVDPGNAGAIPVTASGVCVMASGGAETRTLAIPTFVGQKLQLCLDDDGGNVVVTVASSFDGTNNTITFADEGDTVFLQASTSGGTLLWRLVENVGAALTAV